MNFEHVSSGAKWEEIVGYCRAVKAGNIIAVTGTAPMNEDGTVHAPGDAYRQATRCFEIIDRALRELGATRDDVIRTRLYVTDIKQWEAFAQAHREYVGGHRPCTTMVEVSSLIDPAMMIEIEADAVV